MSMHDTGHAVHAVTHTSASYLAKGTVSITDNHTHEAWEMQSHA